MKKFSYFAAISLTFIAQAAWALPPSKVTIEQVVNQAVTLKTVTLSTPTAASVTLTTGLVWKFGTGSATVAGVAAAPSALKVGMSCILNGLKGTSAGNAITTLAC